jgi:hypothetical protein
MLPTWLIAAIFVTVTAPGGNEIVVNATEISSIRQPSEVSSGHLAKDVHCVLFMTSGQSIGVVETCREVVKLLADADKRNGK